MAATATPYVNYLLALGEGQINFNSNTFKVMLTTSAYVPDFAANTVQSDVTNELTGTNYSPGGAVLSGTSWSYDSLNNRVVFAAAAVTWSSATFSGARQAVIYQATGASSVNLLIGCIDFGVDKTASAEDFQLTFSSGVARIKAG